MSTIDKLSPCFMCVDLRAPSILSAHRVQTAEANQRKPAPPFVMAAGQRPKGNAVLTREKLPAESNLTSIGLIQYVQTNINKLRWSAFSVRINPSDLDAALRLLVERRAPEIAGYDISTSTAARLTDMALKDHTLGPQIKSIKERLKNAKTVGADTVAKNVMHMQFVSHSSGKKSRSFADHIGSLNLERLDAVGVPLAAGSEDALSEINLRTQFVRSMLKE